MSISKKHTSMYKGCEVHTDNLKELKYAQKTVNYFLSEGFDVSLLYIYRGGWISKLSDSDLFSAYYELEDYEDSYLTLAEAVKLIDDMITACQERGSLNKNVLNLNHAYTITNP